MSMKKINEIRQRHLATKQRLVTERAIAAKTHDTAVNALYEKILQHLDSKAAYDSEGLYMDGNVCYKDTAWVKITRTAGDVKPHIELPGKAYAEYLDYTWGDEIFMQILHDVLKKFEGLEGFEVVGYRVIMLLEG